MAHGYAKTLEYLFAQLPMYQRVGASAYKKDLTNAMALCALCHNPQNSIQTIHIAGTNGKGTTSHVIAAGLQAQGYKVGVYTSPHYKDFRERIKINGEYIDKKYIVDFIASHKTNLHKIQPSFFEMTVAMAFAYFKDKGVDYAVIETGLGGRLDSTNIITPMISIITNISKDHVAMLGDSLEDIAFEKAGIIKSQVPVVIGEYQQAVAKVFEKKAKEMNARIYWADQNCNIIKNPKGGLDIYMHDKLWIENLSSPLRGPFAQKNLISGMYALYQLSEKILIDCSKIVDFFPSLIEKTNYIGRWVQLSVQPLTIADSAHNEGGLTEVLGELMKMPYQHLHIVLGFVNDKDITSILNIFPKSATYYFAKAKIPRGLPAKDLKNLARVYGLKGKDYSSVSKAYAAARISANSDDMIFIGGSIFIVAEVVK